MRDLNSLAPFLISANVRKRFSPDGLVVVKGRGQVGDLVVGEVIADAEASVTVFDQDLKSRVLQSTTRVLAVLGTRMSTTHVNAGIPSGGLEIVEGTEAHWIAGESGLVGLLVHEANPDTPYKAETSVGFRCLGLVARPSGEVVNLASLAVEPASAELTTPLLLIGATAAEVGKTTLVKKILGYLVAVGRRVAAVKVTGTGGTMDSQAHREAGAFMAVDQVDAGLITTYCEPATFRQRILRSFLFAQDHDPDLILGELGGDLTFANNPTFLRMTEIRENLQGLVVISSDPLSCYGVARYLEDELQVPKRLVRHFTSPFRNPAGMKARAAVMGVDAVYDPNDLGEIRAVINDLAGA